MKTEITPQAKASERYSRIVSSLLVALMIACIGWTVASLANHIMPDWQLWYLAGLALFTALDRLYTFTTQRHLTIFTRDWNMAVLTEWVMLAVITKIVTGLNKGADRFLDEILHWQEDFPASMLTADFVFSLFAVVVFWLVSGAFAEILDDLTLREALWREEVPSAAAEKLPARIRLINLIASVGTVMVVLTGLMRLDLRGFTGSGANVIPNFTELPSFAGGGGSTLVFFLLALALLSQTQLLDLQAQWLIQRIPIRREVAGRWARYSIFFLVGLALLVSFLPTSYSLSLLVALGYLLGIVSNWLFFGVQAIISLLIFLISLPFLLMGQESPVKNQPVTLPEAPELPKDFTGQALSNDAWLEVLKSTLFWGVLLGVIILALGQYLREHKEFTDSLRRIPGGRWLAAFLEWLRGLGAQVKESVSTVVEAARKRLSRSATPENNPLGFLSLRALSPREKVYFFYLALVRRGNESGLTRSASQTPYEYAATLDSALPTVDKDVNALTEAFVAARYTKQEVEPEKVSLVQHYWERIKKALRGKR